jgi:hypothetical protein
VGRIPAPERPRQAPRALTRRLVTGREWTVELLSDAFVLAGLATAVGAVVAYAHLADRMVSGR